ncbi:hypothetical protein B566_EDAN007714 [Ephemera danica]|nr:hypothetical protein B566_EDAN007714 [Ephemera danica]
MAAVEVIQTTSHEIKLPANFALPEDYTTLIPGKFIKIIHEKKTSLQSCRIRVANMSCKRKLINEFDLLQNKINNYEYFLRPLCIAKDNESLMLFSTFEVHPRKCSILPSDNLSEEQKWIVTKQILEVLDYLQMKEIVLMKLEQSDFEILSKGNDIRVKVHLLNTEEMDRAKNRVQKSIFKVGLAIMKIHWPDEAQNIECILENMTEINLNDIAAVFNQVSMTLTSDEFLLVSLLLTMIRLPEESRPEWSALLLHPYFWTPHRKNDFIQMLVQLKVTINCSDDSDPFKDWKQEDKMKALVEINPSHSKSYGAEDISTHDKLIKLYRDKYQHRSELEDDALKNFFGTTILDVNTYLSFFTTRFPKLLMWLWHCARNDDMTVTDLDQFYPTPNIFVEKVRNMLTMLCVFVWLLLAIFILETAMGQSCADYRQFPKHTMCIYKPEACQRDSKLIRSGGLTEQQKSQVVNIHNKSRQRIVNGEIKGAPAAVYMEPMVWDDELATIAQRAADQCKFEHDKQRTRFYVGQNIYISMRKPIPKNLNPNMTEATLSWFNEVYKPGFPAQYISPFKAVKGAGHYTQIAWADTKTIGCGYTMFINKGWGKKLIFCNYGPGGNILRGTMYEVKSRRKRFINNTETYKHNNNTHNI